ncbi:MAG TPA: DegT/DnrJ/EryC1/StrS family aminotransferase, partial [Candidatus Eremiobacteraceae bacterium]
MVPFVDLKRQHARIAPDLQNAIARVLEDCGFAQGRDLEEFEREFARYIDSAHCVGTSSGTAALKLALEALGVGPGDEVIVPVNTFAATAFAVTANNATPVFVDVDPDTLLLSIAAVAGATTARTKAVMPVHLFGQVVEMDPIMLFARERGLFVVEDAAQAHGAEYRGKNAGTFGDAGCFSFYPTKNIGALGDGGALLTNDPELARIVRAKRWLGQEKTSRYRHDMLGENSVLDTLHAAVLRVKLAHLKAWNDERRAAAAHYRDLFDGAAGIKLVAERGDGRHVYHLMVVLVDDRTNVEAALREAGIGYGIHYPMPLHRQAAFAGRSRAAGPFPVAEDAASRMLSLPM